MTEFPELEILTFEQLDGGIGVLRNSGLRALILTGTGQRAFCAGFDLTEFGVITKMGVREFLKFQGRPPVGSVPFGRCRSR